MATIAQFLLFLINLAWIIVIASAILSWLLAFGVVNSRNQFVATVGGALYRLTEPVYRPIRQFLPDLGGIDLSPLVVLLGLYLLELFIRNNLLPLAY